MSGLYVLMLSVHGLLRAEEPELGVDADTGGQTLYVLELARALGRNPMVDRVDLLTRLVEDPRVAPDYARPANQTCRNKRSRIREIQPPPVRQTPRHQKNTGHGRSPLPVPGVRGCRPAGLCRR